ncbi:MAG: hypothetical protein PWQ06_1499 [Anaerophaga sp.]|nr:hypothetical protein [Anaerophaga sp.]
MAGRETSHKEILNKLITLKGCFISLNAPLHCYLTNSFVRLTDLEETKKILITFILNDTSSGLINLPLWYRIEVMNILETIVA